MGKLLGYLIALIGLALLALSLLSPNLLPAVIKPYSIIAGIVLVIVGVFLSMTGSKTSSRNVKQSDEEVPIFEGEGKKRKIVGYKRAK